MKIELRWAYNNLSNIMTPPYTLPMIPPIKPLLFNYFTKLVLFLIYIPDYCNLLTYKHYQKVAFFGSIFGSIIIKCYLSSFYLWIPSNILFIIYLLFVVKFVLLVSSEFGKWMKSNKAWKILRSSPIDYPKSNKYLYLRLEELIKSYERAGGGKDHFSKSKSPKKSWSDLKANECSKTKDPNWAIELFHEHKLVTVDDVTASPDFTPTVSKDEFEEYQAWQRKGCGSKPLWFMTDNIKCADIMEHYDDVAQHYRVPVDFSQEMSRQGFWWGQKRRDREARRLLKMGK